MQRKVKIILIVSAILIFLIALLVHHHAKKVDMLDQQQAANNKPILVRVQKPIQQSLAITAKATGTLIADKSTIITPRASGYIRAIRFHEGDQVKTNQVLFELDSQTQKNALTAAQAAYALSKVVYDRDARFLKRGFITQDMYYSAKATLKQNEAALQTAQTNLKDRTITAPFSGTVGSLSVSLGDYVNPGNTLTTLTDNKQLRVKYALPAKQLNAIQLNQSVSVVDPANRNHIIATVSYISPTVDANTQTIAVHANINNKKGLFKPGEYVTVSQKLGSEKNALLVPQQSVLASINGYHVFVVKNNKIKQVPVKIGDQENGNVVIQSGLAPTDQVVIAGENEVKPNQTVSIATQ